MVVVCFLLKSFDICKLSFLGDGRCQHWICIALDFYCFSMLDWIQSPDPSSSCFYSGLHLFSYKGAKEGFKSKNEQMWIKVFFFRFFTRESHILTLRVYRALRRSRESRRGSWWWGRIGGQRKVCRHLWGLWWWHSWWGPLKTVSVLSHWNFWSKFFLWQISMQFFSINSEPHFLLGRESRKKHLELGEKIAIDST